jgi:Tfp pilus assembly protein PilE
MIELLAVMVILGLLATIAIGKFSEMRNRTYVSSMKADLRNLATQQEIYYQGPGDFKYTNNLTALNFTPSAGVTVTVEEVTIAGWSARAVHASSPYTCALFIGDANTLAPATQTGVTLCVKP